MDNKIGSLSAKFEQLESRLQIGMNNWRHVPYNHWRVCLCQSNQIFHKTRTMMGITPTSDVF